MTSPTPLNRRKLFVASACAFAAIVLLTISARFSYQDTRIASTITGLGGRADQKSIMPFVSRLIGSDVATYGAIWSVQMEADTFDDSHVALISQSTQIESLWLRGSKVTDMGLMAIAQHDRIRHLILSSTSVTDEGLSPLSCLTTVERLDLSNTHVMGYAFKDRSFDRLLILDISGCVLKDYSGLVRMTSLRTLIARNSNISDDHVALVAQIPNIAVLDLRDSKVTQSGLDELLKAKPGLEIRR